MVFLITVLIFRSFLFGVNVARGLGGSPAGLTISLAPGATGVGEVEITNPAPHPVHVEMSVVGNVSSITSLNPSSFDLPAGPGMENPGERPSQYISASFVAPRNASGCTFSGWIVATTIQDGLGEQIAIRVTISVSGRTIIVPDDYPTIQEAINAAGDEDTIFVRNGTYCENVVVNKTLCVMGQDRETTIIDGNGTGTVITIEAKAVFISGFTLQNGADYPSSIISVLNSSDVGITHSNIRTSGAGVLLQSSTGNTISDNDVQNTFYGILLIESYSNIISSNNVSSNVYGIYLNDSSTDNVVCDNNVSSTNKAGIFLRDVPNNIVARNTVFPSGIGICVGESGSGNELTDNIIGWNGMGVYLQGGQNNTVSGNTLTENNEGVYMDGSFNYTILYHNNFINNTVQVNNSASNFPLLIFWDDGYPSGGNYWSDYTGIDYFSGPYQNITGSDGIGDTSYVIDANNTDNYPLMKPWPATDIAITSATPCKRVVGQGYTVSIGVAMQNLGDCDETFTVTICANTTVINQTQTTLASRNPMTMTIEWDTTGFAMGEYTISANVTQVLGETDMTNNNLTGGTVYVGIPGDVDASGLVNMLDLYYIALHYGTSIGQTDYVPNYDIDGSGLINMLDLYIVALHYGQSAP
jgi:parallel beta-helix repeat protein